MQQKAGSQVFGLYGKLEHLTGLHEMWLLVLWCLVLVWLISKQGYATMQGLATPCSCMQSVSLREGHLPKPRRLSGTLFFSKTHEEAHKWNRSREKVEACSIWNSYDRWHSLQLASWPVVSLFHETFGPCTKSAYHAGPLHETRVARSWLKLCVTSALSMCIVHI